MPDNFNVIKKQGLLIFGGEASDDYGMVVAEAPAFDAPARKCEVVSVPGRNGSILFQQDAYNDVVRSYRVWLDSDRGDAHSLARKINAFEAFLNSKKGYQRLEDDFEPEAFRLAYYNGGAEFSNHMTMYGEATLSFTCRPERFYKDGEQEITVTNGVKLYNPTKFESKPLIYIQGSGNVTVSISGVSITANVTNGYIYIDCDRLDAYRQASENMNSKVSGTFPTIKPGENGIGISGTTTKVTITPRYFTI